MKNSLKRKFRSDKFSPTDDESKKLRFQFFGIKNSGAILFKNNENLPLRKDEASLSDVAASFQQAAFDVLISKTLRAAKEFKAKSIMISGGVAANKTLKKNFKKPLNFSFPILKFPNY